MDVLRLLRTASYLKPQQIYGRVAFRLPRPLPRQGDVPSRRPVTDEWTLPVAHAVSMLGPDRVRFLNEEGVISGLKAWNDPSRERLWLYNLHYFDDLNALNAAERRDWHRVLVDRWVRENPPASGAGWEPYPTSLRVVNWIKWALRGELLDDIARGSIAPQMRWLESHVEWHLLGNHLLANAKALVFAGLFFDGPEADRWWRKGAEIFRLQLPEQILDDGGHFERSPMYHAIILEDLLDVLNLCRTFDRPVEAIHSELNEVIARMFYWLRGMCLGDGRIAFFNDAAFGIAAEPNELADYASSLGLKLPSQDLSPLVELNASGYARLSDGDAVVIADMAPVGPEYLPGHAHADTLSFEFSLGTERVVVNGGTSIYGTGAQRSFERSTAAHSTVEIDGESSSEVWSGFRVGRRARVVDIEAGTAGELSVSASHDGYAWRNGKPIHRRTWVLGRESLAITDRIIGRAGSGEAHFHLGAGVDVHLDSDLRSGSITLPSRRVIKWTSSAPAATSESSWHPEFGLSIATKQLRIGIGDGSLETRFTW